MHANSSNGRILLNRHLKATSQACAVVSNVLDFDSVELWVQEGAGNLTCVFIYATDEVSKEHPVVRTTKTFYPTTPHSYSPQLCNRVRESASPVYWRSADGAPATLYPESPVPFRSEFSYRVDTHSATELIYIVGFSRQIVPLIPNRERFLAGISYAIYVSAFGVERSDSRPVAGGSAASPKRPAGSDEGRTPDHSHSHSHGSSALLDRKEPSLGHSSPNRPFVFDLSAVTPVKTLLSNVKLTDVVGLRHIADGSHSHILVGELNKQKVVIKILKEESVDNEIAIHEYEVEREVLSRVDHPHVVSIVGCGVFPRRFLVLELLEGDTLGHILSKHVSKPGIRIFHKPSFTYLQLLQLGRSIANALGHLHCTAIEGATIIHRDLKPDNIAFTKSGCVKIIDFGLCTCVRARDAATEAYEMTGNTGSKRYMAPEVALKQPYNEKADVYSFGIILWQMARDKVPFSKMGVDEFIQKVSRGGERPKLDKAWPERFSALLSLCWDASPANRPSFQGVVRMLEALILAEGGTPTPLPENRGTRQRPGMLEASKSTPAMSKSSSSLVDKAPPPPRPSSLRHPSPPAATAAASREPAKASGYKDIKRGQTGWF